LSTKNIFRLTNILCSFKHSKIGRKKNFIKYLTPKQTEPKIWFIRQ
jgi:hypothetical protein